MRKLFAVILTLTIILCFVGCSGTQDNLSSLDAANSDTITSDDTTTLEISSDDSSSSKPNVSSNKKPSSNVGSVSSKQPSAESSFGEYPATDFYELSCRHINSNEWKTIRVKNSKKSITVEFEIPFDWTLSKKSDTTYNILRSGKQIGLMTTGSIDKPKNAFAVSLEALGGFELTQQINWYKQNNKDQFYKCYNFDFLDKYSGFDLNFKIEYTEIDTYSEYDFKEKLHIFNSNINLDLTEKTNGSKKILVIGNSFVSSSNIGAYLEDMMLATKNGYEVRAISRGMASVHTFLQDQYLLETCVGGEYSYVFMCGFYSMDTLDSFDTLVEAAKVTNTKLVIFPAHNEDQKSIDAAVARFSGVGFIDWKGEINTLIESGVDYFDFCYDDGYQHSKPLAGYVGAHMIYRALMGKAPEKVDREAEQKLGNYCREGIPDTFSGQVFEIK